jgi:diguanylate cyclase (GGDEF)-like protein
MEHRKEIPTNFNNLNDALQNSLEFASYVDLFDRINDSILILDPDTLNVCLMNPSSERFFETTLDSLKIFDLISENDKDIFIKHLNTLARRYNNKELKTKFLINNDWKHVHISMGSLELKNEQRVIQLIIKDVTELIQLQLKLEQLSITDGLTGLFNKRHFESTMKSKLEESFRNDSNFSLIMLDIDNFKHYNDRNGHGAGDLLLKEFAEELRHRVRNIDIICRYGGEEFAIICPNTELEQALIVANRIKESLNKRPFKFAEFQPLGFISASIGISNIPYHIVNEWNKTKTSTEMESYIEECISKMKKISDDNLYKAKESGRNCVSYLK